MRANTISQSTCRPQSMQRPAVAALGHAPVPRLRLRPACLHQTNKDNVQLAGTAAAPAAAPMIPAVTGRVHSTESFSAVDGPGLRFIVFTQGCASRCLFCCNPDTWDAHAGRALSSKDIAARLARVAPYLRPGSGGVTCSGGEALMQPEFVAAVFQEAHALGLTSCLDTTGHGTKAHSWDVVLPHTDSVLFCIKHADPQRYHALTGMSQVAPLLFAAELGARRIPFWLRYVLIPGHTDAPADIAALADFCKQQPTLQGVELLPYHELGLNKWSALGLAYPLAGVQPPRLEAVLAVVGQLQAASLTVACDAQQRADQRAQHVAIHAAD